MFTRQGKHFRGNEYFDPKLSFENSFPYLSRQISIIRPKIIIPLGNLALQTVDRHFDLGFKRKTISQVINEISSQSSGCILADSTYIVPCFHPAAHINPDLQASSWRVLWDLIEK